MSTRAAIMQPYFLPYLGYFQLIAAVDTFIIYDDVNFIKQGFSHRNNLLLNNEKYLVSLSLNKPSQNKTFRETYLSEDPTSRTALLTTIQHAYAKAPQFAHIFPLVQHMLSEGQVANLNFAGFIHNHLQTILGYYGIPTKLVCSSTFAEQLPAKDTSTDKDTQRAQALINICKHVGATTYINAPGGKELYTKETFAAQGIQLRFLEPKIEPYPQFGAPFVPYLSFLDIMMFNPPEHVKHMLTASTLS